MVKRFFAFKLNQSLVIRGFDCVVALVLLVMLTPLLLLLAALVRLFIGQRAIFTQIRAGQGGRPFAIYKFTTMRWMVNEHGDLLPDEDRVTSLGCWLRRWSLDELPQLLNVLKGDLSLVGPRPLLYEYIPLYTREQKKRFDVPAGITGWAQIHGRNALSWEQRFEYDVWYVQNRSIWLNIKILWRTIFCVWQGRGIYATHKEMKKFTGSASDHRCP